MGAYDSPGEIGTARASGKRAPVRTERGRRDGARVLRERRRVPGGSLGTALGDSGGARRDSWGTLPRAWLLITSGPVGLRAGE